MRRPPPRTRAVQASPVATAIDRANRARRKDDLRGELTALRQACLMDEWSAVLWARYGDALMRASKYEDAQQAFRHALWLRERADDEARARVLRRLLVCAKNRMPARDAA